MADQTCHARCAFDELTSRCYYWVDSEGHFDELFLWLHTSVSQHQWGGRVLKIVKRQRGDSFDFSKTVVKPVFLPI